MILKNKSIIFEDRLPEDRASFVNNVEDEENK